MSSDDFRYWLDDCRDGPGMFRAGWCEFISLAVRFVLLGVLSMPVVYLGIYLAFDHNALWIPLKTEFWGILSTVVVVEVGAASDFTRPPGDSQ